MSYADSLKLFHVAHTMIAADLERVENELGVDLGLLDEEPDSSTDAEYAQFGALIRAEASAMARQYEVFYCLENSIRELVRDMMIEQHGETWWEHVPDEVKQNAAQNRKREEDAAVSLRSEEMNDYTTFGELLKIIQTNWDVFGAMFNNRTGVTRVLSGLNVLRSPIAHCAPLAEDEVLRLRVALRDWFRLMG